MKHRFSSAAEAEFLDIIAYYEARVRGLGAEFRVETMRYISIIEANPQGFSLAARCPRGREIRVVKLGRFDYLLYHEVLPTEVVTIAIQHARRKSTAWRKRIT